MTAFAKPICFFDLETTGTEISKSRIVDIGIIRVHDLGTEDETIDTFETLVNPGCPITNSNIHGITDEMVADAPKFEAIAVQVWEFIKGCDLAGNNVKAFDIPLLAEEIARNSKHLLNMEGRNVYDQLTLHRKLNPANLSALYKKYTGKDLEGAHRSIADSNASLEIFKAMLVDGLAGKTPDQIIELQDGKDNRMVDLAGKLYRNEDGVICFNFGQHKDKPAASKPAYLQWMMAGDFTAETKGWVNAIYCGKLEERLKSVSR